MIDQQQQTKELKYGQLPPEEEQEGIVKKTMDRINAYAFYMNRSFDDNKPDEGIDYATKMLEEMKTNALSPVHYNELSQTVLSELSTLSRNVFISLFNELFVTCINLTSAKVLFSISFAAF